MSETETIHYFMYLSCGARQISLTPPQLGAHVHCTAHHHIAGIQGILLYTHKMWDEVCQIPHILTIPGITL